MEFTGERFVPEIEDEKLSIEHMQRYLSIVPLVKGKKVLDIACGEGYGSAILGKEAADVTGMDIDEETVKWARKKYASETVRYKVGNIAEIPMEDHSIDVLVSFETIEHVNEELQQKFIKEAKRVLKNDGLLIMSSPNKEIYSDKYNYHNEFHVKEFYFREFVDFIQQEFSEVEIYNQRFQVASIIEPLDADEKKLRRIGDRKHSTDGKYYIAIASNRPIEHKEIASAYVTHMGEYDELIERIITLQNEEEQRNQHIKKLDAEIDKNRQDYARVNEELEKTQKTATEEIARVNEEKSKLELSLKTVTEEIAQVNQELLNKQGWIEQLLETERANNREIADLKQQVLNKQGWVEQLLEVERAYERDKATITYRTMASIRRFADWCLPEYSKRRFFLGVLAKTIRHPILMSKVITPKRIASYFRISRTVGMRDVLYQYNYTIKEEKVAVGMEKPEGSVTVNQIECKSEESAKIEDYAKLSFKKWENPEVSIVIPVYNQFAYTYACLESILKNSGEDIKYEIIIADDCSTDLTTELEKVAENIVIAKTEGNCRFLLNCNNAAKYANGKYILFLNNDTQVQENWLEPLVSLMEKDETIGMTGSKLVYPDGKLQEAGGILWNDGSAWNYGRGKDATDPEYNYVKEVDYISGAAIMIRRNLWEEIGGFDERYVPAYCEDSDLAFEVRQHGYKVMYQPLSVVVHFEGASNGTDLSTGVKKYQTDNQQKFLEKWKDVLSKEHFENGTEVFLAADRSRNKKHVLFIDHYVPTYDKDAGSKTTFMYLKMLIKKGYSITFLPDNFYKEEPYCTALQQLGIFVLYGNYYGQNYKMWLKENLRHFDVVYPNRPHITINYIDILNQYADHKKTKIIYYGHDLHFLRNYREYELTGNQEKLKESEEWKKKEFAIMKKADMSYFPSEIEIDAIHEIDPKINAKAITAYVYEDLPEYENDADQRQGLLFVGGFGHPPNIDAVDWFRKEVYPKVYEKLKIPFYIVGSRVPDEWYKLEQDGVEIKGFVSDEELAKLYKQCRLDIVPLRYGAGVKGKVVEAMANGIPMITTSVGAEGIGGIEEIVPVIDNADEMAEKIIEIYQDTEQLNKMAEGEQQYIRDKFSTEAVWNIIKEDFGDTDK